jgi:hypothetical protein
MKEIVYVENFSHSKRTDRSYVEALRNRVLEGLLKTERIIVKDVNAEASLEKELQKQTEDASRIDESTLVIMRSLNAKYIISGYVSSIDTMLVKGKENNPDSYKGIVSCSLNVIDVSTGTVKGTKNYQMEGTGSTVEQAIAHTKTSSYSIGGGMKALVDDYFKLKGVILEISAEKKKKATEVYIDLGALVGVQKNQRFDVFIEREIAGRTSQKKIGELKVDVVEGDEIALCKVTKGGEEIKQAVGEGQKITIISTQAKLFDGLFDL